MDAVEAATKRAAELGAGMLAKLRSSVPPA
jgi:hypothetical protein